LADPFSFDEVDLLQHLALQFHQLGARLPKAAIGMSALLEGFELSGLRDDILRSRTPSIREHLGVM
jgi:hypothetical protein